jgi:tRNA(fMet)-specific endonuclease VapC
MRARYLLDTNICIYIQRQKPGKVLARFQKLKPGDAAISVITWGELLYGAEKSQQRKKALLLLEEFKTLVPVLPIPENAGKTYGAIRASLESLGKPIGNNDLWIAAHAKAATLTIVTNNEQGFKQVPGLKVQNWVITQDF